MNATPTTLPYCGLPAQPATVWSDWNLDPWLLAAFAITLGAFAWRWSRIPVAERQPGRAAYFYAAWTVSLLALASPLCALSVALFSARVAQHMVLSLVAAPLLVMARIDLLIVPQTRARSAGRSWWWAVLTSGRTAWVLFAMALWFWHVPASYSLTFASTFAYWTMHVSLFVAAYLMWFALLVRYQRQPVMALVCGLGTAVQMGLLGGLLTFARRPLYSEHWGTALDWGYTSLSDQQVGGLVMWIPGCSVFLIVAVAAVASLWCDGPVGAAPRRAGNPSPYRIS